VEKVILLTVTIIMSVSVLPCITASQLNNNMMDKEAIVAVIEGLYQAFDEGDFEEAGKYIAENYEFISVAGKRYDWITIKKLLEGLNSTGFKAEISNMKMKIIGEVAWGSWEQNNKEMRGDKIIEDNTLITGIFIKKNGRWLWIHAHETKIKDES
jgi:hypothetical protein